VTERRRVTRLLLAPLLKNLDVVHGEPAPAPLPKVTHPPVSVLLRMPRGDEAELGLQTRSGRGLSYLEDVPDDGVGGEGELVFLTTRVRVERPDSERLQRKKRPYY
jgi:hypothetical protein